ncbi:hypothetical protein AX774_g6570 [Zancudomyces culisetae]|uniref:Uncharacterized protein n=1 Tax=Zancudomyces culisetae TaxID=1213189 RepID=A0A1R1PGA0_ZANCU|nr:hypothetical protein AX774_g6570 [Zancudomyces culisetae]|eukprot:OMH80004.1 hypothetical protein AX774_g6570 [Zancudomyces culisetae]
MDDEDRPRRRKVRKLKFELFNAVGCFGASTIAYAKPNKCYSAANFAAVRMSCVNNNKGAMMFCSEANCTGKCFVVPRSAGSDINGIYYQIGNKAATSYSWIAPYF